MAAPIFEIKDIKHRYAGRTVLEIDRLNIQPASIVGLIGPNGSGKSTLLKLMGLIEKPTQGDIQFNGRPVEPFSQEARFRTTLLPQEPFLMKRNVFNNVTYGLKLRGNGGSMMKKAHKALAMVGLEGDEFLRRPWYALSGGEAQRVALAARLALKPRVLLLDEPTASVDAGSAQLIKEAALKARQESGTTLVIASHDLQWLFEICDEVLHLFKGKILGKGRETVIFGPWHELSTGQWGKVLPDAQLLRVPTPPNPEAPALIDLLPAGTEPTGETDAMNVLKGTVSRLSLEKKTGHVFATVLVGGHPLTMRMAPDQKERQNIYPGDTIAVHYRIDQVTWV
ncbi:MAG: energy-coupling factor ABC transporter ATP-binding protein [Thermodesulfobacteriota bacterium]